MKILVCPLNGPRNISEFTYGGEYHALPDPAQSDDRAWAEYVFFHDNKAGVVIEWWCHTASSHWFLAERDTRTDKVLRTFPVTELAANGGRT
ncbi:MAG: sarcosine oxidase subunit delta [Woeseiaceae bacterium]